LTSARPRIEAKDFSGLCVVPKQQLQAANKAAPQNQLHFSRPEAVNKATCGTIEKAPVEQTEALSTITCLPESLAKQ
jgi:hypothetical protein